jgi:hypothetical protein
MRRGEPEVTSIKVRGDRAIRYPNIAAYVEAYHELFASRLFTELEDVDKI